MWNPKVKETERDYGTFGNIWQQELKKDIKMERKHRTNENGEILLVAYAPGGVTGKFK